APEQQATTLPACRTNASGHVMSLSPLGTGDQLYPSRVGRAALVVDDGEQVPARGREVRVVGYLHVELAQADLVEGEVDEALFGVAGMGGGHRAGDLGPHHVVGVRGVQPEPLAVGDGLRGRLEERAP